jgi:hypothetical protein
MRRVTFHTFTMGDVDDPEIYVAQPVYEWQQTEPGQWVMQHCKDPKYTLQSDEHGWGHRVILYGDLDDKDATFWQLKWGKHDKSL